MRDVEKESYLLYLLYLLLLFLLLWCCFVCNKLIMIVSHMLRTCKHIEWVCICYFCLAVLCMFCAPEFKCCGFPDDNVRFCGYLLNICLSRTSVPAGRLLRNIITLEEFGSALIFNLRLYVRNILHFFLCVCIENNLIECFRMTSFLFSCLEIQYKCMQLDNIVRKKRVFFFCAKILFQRL